MTNSWLSARLTFVSSNYHFLDAGSDFDTGQQKIVHFTPSVLKISTATYH